MKPMVHSGCNRKYWIGSTAFILITDLPEYIFHPGNNISLQLQVVICTYKQLNLFFRGINVKIISA